MPQIANGVITGTAARYNTLSGDLGGFREIIRPGAFDRSLREIQEGKRHCDARTQHKGGLDVCGTTRNGSLRLRSDNVGLHYDIDPPATQNGQDLQVMIRDGYLSKSSFAFTCEPSGMRWDYTQRPPVVELLDVDLVDVAPCSGPAYEETAVAMRSLLQGSTGIPAPAPGGKSRVEIKNEAGRKTAELYLLDMIAPRWLQNYMPDTASTGRIIDELKAVPDAERIDVFISSPGGDVFEGMGIYNTLKQHAAPVHVFVQGYAASIASVIAMAGDHIQMGEGTFMMVHRAWTGMQGNAQDLRKEASLLDKVDGSIAGILAKRSGKSTKEVEALMAEETWMTAAESVDMGFADRISGTAVAMSGEHCRAMGFRKIPSALGGSLAAEPDRLAIMDLRAANQRALDRLK